MMAGLLYRPVWTRYLLLIFAEIAAVIGIFSKPSIGDRFVTIFIAQLPLHEASPYRRVWNGGIGFHLTLWCWTG